MGNKGTKDYHALSVEEVLETFGVDPKRGLSRGEVEKRLDEYGLNQLQEEETRSALQVLLDQFKSTVIIVLVVAGAVAFSFGRFSEGIAIVAVLFVNAAIGFGTEIKALDSMKALRALSSDAIRVRRDGEDQEIDSNYLAPGDIIFVEAGDMAPADVRIIESNRIRVNESALTGESVPVRKQSDPTAADAVQADRNSMLYKGTTITEGSGEGVVTATGENTELGRISTMAREAQKETTPLQQRLDQLGRRLAWITLGIASMIGVIGLLAGREPLKTIETAIALGVAAIPEGLPIVSTIALARGMYLMSRRNVLINKLPAVETLGAVQTIFTDKTGTLTENKMTLRKLATPGGDFEIDEIDKAASNSKKTPNPLFKRILEVGVLCNNASLRDADNDNEFEEEQGDPTETALLRAGMTVGFQRNHLLESKPELREAPFDADLMMMATFHQLDRGIDVAVKGAPSRILDACTRVASENGEGENPFTDEMREEWQERVESMAGEGFRVLGVADKVVDDLDASPYEGLRFLGILGLFDPPRKDVRDSIEECKTAGIRLVMITGDKSATAAAIGKQTGICGAGEFPAVMQGNELKDPDAMSDEDRRQALETDIFARVSPEQKLLLIKLTQKEGVTTAMTGDGVNDAPALKKADIGIAMGRRGTDAAREVADMVLRDDAFSSITAAVKQGRIIFDNIRKSVMFMLCTNVAEVIAVAVAAVIGGFSEMPIPILPLQILYLNVITDVFPALALGMSKGTEEVMQRNPRPGEEAVLTRHHWRAIGGWAILVSASVLVSLAIAFYRFGFNEQRAVTVSFLTLAFAKLWFVFNLRNPGTRMFDNDIVRNPYIIGSIILCTALLLAAVYLPGLSGVLKTESPGVNGWLLLLGMSLFPFIWGQGLRILQLRKQNRNKSSNERYNLGVEI